MKIGYFPKQIDKVDNQKQMLETIFTVHGQQLELQTLSWFSTRMNNSHSVERLLFLNIPHVVERLLLSAKSDR